ncbi:LCP family protein [Patulibacter defluvii]|uniref:LCP family protein n=1 Tax=Patulibacter defluvii TaxID=3095358 RepID=UPI002A74E971|nr:LCP family protein [Patulibacter sp. DM4]
MSTPAADRPPRPGVAFALRFLLAGIIVLVVAGAAVATTIENEAQKSIDALGPETKLPGLEGVLSDVQPGKPQTIMLVGDDRRLDDPKGTTTRSDTMILVRLDPEANATTMLSLPRDLLVDLPGQGRTKLNNAYAGGPKRLIETIQTMLSTPDEPFLVHHFVSIRFGAFSRAVNFFGCFYADIDRKYFNPPGTGWAAIDVDSGYQRICGEKSLDYVRFRHLDSDLVREARQTNYLAEARAQIANSEILDKRNDLLRAIRRYVKTDIGSAKGLLGVIRLAVDVAGKPTQRVTLRVGDAGDKVSVVTTPDALATAARQFLHPGTIPGEKSRAARDAAARTGEQPAKTTVRKRKARTPGTLFANPDAARQTISASIASKIRMPIYYPKLMRTSGRYRAEDSRGYDIQSENGKTFPWQAYRIVVAEGGVGQYYGIQGTTWKDPPILKLADDEERIGGRKWRVQYDGKKIRRLMWSSGRGTYWINNTLSNELSNPEMRSLARSLTRYSG